MQRSLCFNDRDEELVRRIEEYQHEHKLKSFIAAVRVLCENGLTVSNAAKNLK